ncbi:hypothetical protein [Cellulomonas carbonis]|uniref:Uncharacterized protein n=1 Tax=Cellulomonas carbonis T26 TaxID=947969 RepID=A0A0A0BQB4_9CELL|nr:hypothetical protein [Cellulomonas carbonis]KGM10161.1 hypothetical protein N868_16505 [Cellulomonas carbonis T26]GGC08667.1 hypothetical protein GCM10010972_22450 [Cellulomonas carbonis]
MTGLRALPLELLPPFTSTAPAKVAAADAAQEAFRGLLLARSWDLLHGHAATLAGLAAALREHAEARAVLHAHHARYLTERDAGLTQVFAALAADGSPEATAIRDALLAQATTELGDPAAAQALVDALLAGNHAVFDARDAERSATVAELDVVGAACVQTAALAARAAIDSALHKAYVVTTAQAAGPDQPADLQVVQDEADALRTLHDDAVGALFAHLDTEDDRDAFADLAVALGSRIASRAPVAAMVVGAYLGLLHQRPSPQGSLAEHRSALDVVELVERLHLVLAYTWTVQVGLLGPDAGRWYSNERRRTDTRTIASQVPEGQPVTAQELLDGTGAEGDMVTVEGVVDGLAIADDPAPPKFSTFCDVVDLATGTSVRVRAHMFSLLNNGLQDGAFTRLTGFVRRSAPWEPTVGLDVDRVDLTDLARQSWYDDVTARLRHHSLLRPDGMSMFFTPPVRTD